MPKSVDFDSLLNPATFVQIKTGIAKSGTHFAFCKYKGRGCILSKELIEAVDLSFDAKEYTISKDRVILKKTSSENNLRMFLKVSKKMWYEIGELKKNLIKGIAWKDFDKEIRQAGLLMEEINIGIYGKFLAIRPPYLYLTNKKLHHINMWSGNSIKQDIADDSTLLDYLEKNHNRVICKSFGEEDKVYYRCYLKKLKNSI